MARASKLTLKSSDDVLFEVSEPVAFQSETIKKMIEDTGTATAIPLHDVSSVILVKVIEYCTFHVDAQKRADENSPLTDDEIKTWDREFVAVDNATLVPLILAANHLKIKNLLDLTYQTVADMMIGRSAEEIRKLFNIKNDFTPEEEEELRRRNQWAF